MMKKDMVEDAVILLRDYLGSEVALNYDAFYRQQNTENIILSLGALFTDLLGEKKASQLLSKFIKKHGLKGVRWK